MQFGHDLMGDLQHAGTRTLIHALRNHTVDDLWLVVWSCNHTANLEIRFAKVTVNSASVEDKRGD